MHQGDWLRVIVDAGALRQNIRQFRDLLPDTARLLAVVKAEGYGHGLEIAARAFLSGGADLLGVHAWQEAARLRAAGVTAPVLVLGAVDAVEAAAAAAADVEVTVGSLAGLEAAAGAARADRPLRIHLKVETGVNRQGIVEGELQPFLARLAAAPGLALVGLSSHYADIEDTTDHGWARVQSDRFDARRARLEAAGRPDLQRHMSCSAAAILWPQGRRDIVRVGVSAYGIWPSGETLVSARAAGRSELELQPALTWICRLAQVRDVPAGESVGYGRTWKAPVDSRIAVLPCGYADGYPRRLSNRAHVLIGGRQAPVRGRVCMNLTMVDVTHVPGAAAGDEAVLLGSQGGERITAVTLADWLDTIPYEVLTLPRANWRRLTNEECPACSTP